MTAGPDMAGLSVRSEIGRLRQVVYCVVSSGIQAIGNTGTITIGRGDTDDHDHSAMRFHLVASSGINPDEVVMPIARSLIEGHGTIAVDHRDDGSVDVDVRFHPGR